MSIHAINNECIIKFVCVCARARTKHVHTSLQILIPSYKSDVAIAIGAFFTMAQLS